MPPREGGAIASEDRPPRHLSARRRRGKGAKPCGRCILTTIDPHTGERDPNREPLATLLKYRQVDGEALLGQNLLPLGRGELRVGMPVEILE